SGGLQTSPVTCGIDEAGRLVVATYPQRAKVANIRRDPAVSACVLSDEWNGPYVHLDATAEVVDLPEAVEPLGEDFRSVSGEHAEVVDLGAAVEPLVGDFRGVSGGPDDWDEYRAAMVRQGKCVVRVTIEDWGPVATGGFPPPDGPA